MRRAGLLPAFLSGGRTEADGVAAAHAFLKSPGNTTAAVLFNDRLAVGFLDTIRRAGRRVPEDLSLIGYDNIPAAALTHLDLTTIAQSPTALAKLATEHATARLTSATTPTEETVTPYLIPRTTTASPSSSTEAFE
jgi:DNA-binding LacI/PurR family transcriptional regulator